MDPVTAALLGSLVGAVAAVGGSAVSSVVSLIVERRRQESTAREAFVQLVRDRCGICFGQLFIVIQEIEWMCWYAEHSPDETNMELINAYEDRVSDAYRTLMGAIAMTASISLPAYDQMRPHLDSAVQVGGTGGHRKPPNLDGSELSHRRAPQLRRRGGSDAGQPASGPVRSHDACRAPMKPRT
jgi:hypothetical protein